MPGSKKGEKDFENTEGSPLCTQIFKHEVFGEIWTMTDEKGEVFFVGKDVAKVLGYAKPENAIAIHVDKEDKTSTLIQGSGSNYKSKAILINESGLYSLAIQEKADKLVEAQVQNGLQNKTAFVRLVSRVRDYTDQNGVVHYSSEMRLTDWELL